MKYEDLTRDLVFNDVLERASKQYVPALSAVRTGSSGTTTRVAGPGDEIIPNWSSVESRVGALESFADPRPPLMQFGHDPEWTNAIAAYLNYPPVLDDFGRPAMLSTDAVCIRRSAPQYEFLAVDCKKTEEDLADIRTLRKLEIKHELWRIAGIRYVTAIENDIPGEAVGNVELVWRYRNVASLPEVNDAVVAQVDEFLQTELRGARRLLGATCVACDKAWGLPPGTSLAIAQWSVARQRWPIAMNKPFHALSPVHFQN